MIRIVVVALLCLFGVTRALAETAGCQIGVIPIAGNKFLIDKYGHFTFLDKYAHVGVVGWDLDELVVARVQAAAPGRTVRRVPFTREELAAARSRVRNPFMRDANFKAFIQETAAKVRCERYVVVHRRGGGGREFGIGISNYGDGKLVYLFAMMHIIVYDGRTFELIKEGDAHNDNESRLERAFHNPVGGPYRKLDAAAFPDKLTEVSGNPVLRDGVRALLTSSLDMTLPAMLGK
jgi:hypothetical protein